MEGTNFTYLCYFGFGNCIRFCPQLMLFSTITRFVQPPIVLALIRLPIQIAFPGPITKKGKSELVERLQS